MTMFLSTTIASAIIWNVHHLSHGAWSEFSDMGVVVLILKEF